MISNGNLSLKKEEEEEYTYIFTFTTKPIYLVGFLQNRKKPLGQQPTQIPPFIKDAI